MVAKPNIKNLTREKLEGLLAEYEEPRFRVQQVWNWLYGKMVISFSDMTNLPQGLRDNLEEKWQISWPQLLRCQESSVGYTRKYLLGLEDGQAIETVLMDYRFGKSLCLTTQVGCAMGCSFCASTLGGKNRDLTVAEMVDQVLFVQKDLGERGEAPVSRVVLMGTGEPLDNYENVISFLEILHDPEGLDISYRRVTLSTCGLVPRIRDLARQGMPITLAVSLHAPDDRLRNRLMPINKTYPIADLLAACQEYFDLTGRRVTFEYTLIAGINDGLEHAVALAKLLRGFQCHVNLIPLNPVPERKLYPSEETQVGAFAGYLQSRGISVTQRRELGQDIDAACGQLRRRFQAEE